MTLNDKLDLLMLSKEERTKAESKFLASVAFLSTDTLKYLNEQGIVIKRAKDIKVATNSQEEVAKKLSILGEIHETQIYEQDPGKLNYNVIDIYKKIQYCKQIGIPYKKEDGTYESFLFSEALWQQVTSRKVEPVVAPPVFTPVEEEMVTLEPEITPEAIAPILEEEAIKPIVDEKHIDIKDYMAADKDMEALEAKTTNFATIREELEGQLAELDALRNMDFGEEISFSDIEPESFGFGGRVA